jgi:hypothetical protein
MYGSDERADTIGFDEWTFDMCCSSKKGAFVRTADCLGLTACGNQMVMVLVGCSAA